MKIPELLAPAGNWSMLRTAVEAGADAVYLGVEGLNMRATARNFTIADLKKITSFAHKQNVKIYLTMNTIVYDHELSTVKKTLVAAKKAGIDAVICWDFAVIELCKELDIEFHISTQASISNAKSMHFFETLGATRCVLARECTIEQLEEMRKKTKMQIEVFAHGAMCVSVSGRCFMSQFMYGRSANRGDCIQPCRRAYDTVLISDKEEDQQLEVGNDYVMSPKDLCTLPFLDKLVPVVDVLKVEGRARSPEYVKVVISTYKEALEQIANGSFDQTVIKIAMKKLESVYNRGFSTGFYMGKPINAFTEEYGSKATRRKVTLGIVRNYYKKSGAAEIELTANSLNVGDTVLIIGETTGTVEVLVESLQIEGTSVKSVKKGQSVGLKVPKLVRNNDAVFLWK
jgi:putative protease